MDRRHALLGVAVAASIATEPPALPPLFTGRQELDVGSFSLDARQPTRSWTITSTVVLPPEASDHPFSSFSEALVKLPAGAPTDPVSVSFGVCAQSVEPWPWESAGGDGPPVAFPSVEDLFVDCAPSEPCSRTTCLAISNADDELAADVWWSTDTWVDSGESLESKHDDSIPVPIEITVEEIEP